MGIGLRIFLVNDDNSIQRLAVARYDRLLRRDPEERLPRYAGKRLGCSGFVLGGRSHFRLGACLVWLTRS